MVTKCGKYQPKTRFFQTFHFWRFVCQVDANWLQRDLEFLQRDLEVLQRDLESREIAVGGTGRRQRRSQRREGEASPPSFERIRITIQLHALLPPDEVRRIEEATASAADLWDPRNGCMDACLCARPVAKINR